MLNPWYVQLDDSHAALLLPASRGRNDCPIPVAKILGTIQQAVKEKL